MIAVQAATSYLLFVSVIVLSIRYGKYSGYGTKPMRDDAIVLGCFILAFVLSLTSLVLRLVASSHPH